MLITSESFKVLIKKYFPKFNFEKELSAEDIFSLKRVIEKRESQSLKQADVVKRFAAIEKNGLRPGVEVLVGRKKLTIESISVDGLIILAGKKGSFSPFFLERI